MAGLAHRRGPDPVRAAGTERATCRSREPAQDLVGIVDIATRRVDGFEGDSRKDRAPIASSL